MKVWAMAAAVLAISISTGVEAKPRKFRSAADVALKQWVVAKLEREQAPDAPLFAEETAPLSPSAEDRGELLQVGCAVETGGYKLSDKAAPNHKPVLRDGSMSPGVKNPPPSMVDPDHRTPAEIAVDGVNTCVTSADNEP